MLLLVAGVKLVMQGPGVIQRPGRTGAVRGDGGLKAAYEPGDFVVRKRGIALRGHVSDVVTRHVTLPILVTLVFQHVYEFSAVGNKPVNAYTVAQPATIQSNAAAFVTKRNVESVRGAVAE
jgi:hypothetical protein